MYGADELRLVGVDETAVNLTARLDAAGPYWLHLDVDVLDEAVFPATDYLQPNGLDWEELEALLAPLRAGENLVGISLACYNPDKDPGLACGRRLVAALGASG